MSPDRWQQVKNTLAAALEFPDPQGRAQFLTQACIDDTALRREVQSLLDQPDDEFESAAEVIGMANADALQPPDTGRQIGNYQLVRELGRGGMGAVWLARRADEQFEKLVAIKLLKRGTDTDEVLRRFHAERRILARLDHPNIARLFDAGTADDGLPYFVMEYIEGVRVTEFVRERRLSIAERLDLFRKICNAVQFAHQNLIVHRDLKPGNILVTSGGDPKLLDFGIAKLLSPGDESWEVTMAGKERLTPGYASPEQVLGEPVTTVSDVYTLGVLLYEILAERPAHRFGTSPPTQTEILRVVAREDPVRPSVAALDPATGRQLRGDLDTIVLRAMAKVPERRYRGAGNLGDDLGRYLDGRPVRARSDTFAYRTRKFLGRNKTGVATSALVLLALLAGIIATSWQARIAKSERAKADRRFQEARRIANSLMFELHDSIKDIPGAMAARQLLMRRALEYLDGLAREAGADLSLKSELSIAYEKIGLVTFDVQQAMDARRKAATINEELVKVAPKNSLYRKQLSESYGNLSDVMKIAGHSSSSIDYARKSLAIAESLSADYPRDNEARARLAGCYLSLGLVLVDAGYFEEAQQSDLKALEVQKKVMAQDPSSREERRELGAFYGSLSNVLEESGNYAAALEYERNELDIAQEFFQADPENARSRRDMWAALFRKARLLGFTGQTDEALENYNRAVGLIEALAVADRADRGHRRWVALTHFSLGQFLATVNQSDRARGDYARAMAISEDLLAADPQRIETRRDLAKIYEALGLLSHGVGNIARVLEYLEKARSLAEESVAQDPGNLRARTRLAQIYADLGLVCVATSDPRAARAWYQRSLDIWQQMKEQGTLNGVDANKPEEIARAIAKCDAALK